MHTLSTRIERGSFIINNESFQNRILAMLKMTDLTPNDIQARIDRLEEILALPETPGRLAKAREARRMAQATFEQAQSLADIACRHFGRQGLDAEHQVPQVRTALLDLETAGRALADAKAGERKAKDRDDSDFTGALAPKLAEAAPIYGDLAALCIEAMQPLLDLHRLAICNNLPMPRLVGAAWGMGEAVRNMTAILNSATAPARQNANED
jgi:hypothetical protein